MPRDLPLQRLRRDLTTGAVRLLVLATIHRQGPLHGYRLVKEIERILDFPKGIKHSTVYPVLEEFEQEGVLESRWGPGPSGPQRKSYEVTPKGRRVLREATLEWTGWRDALDEVLPTLEPQMNVNGNGARPRSVATERGPA